MKNGDGKYRFVFSEVFNNTNGKTSGSGFIGVVMGLVGCLGFIAAIVGYFMGLPNTIAFMQQTIFFIGSATVLLGARKWVGQAQSRDTATAINVENKAAADAVRREERIDAEQERREDIETNNVDIQDNKLKEDSKRG